MFFSYRFDVHDMRFSPRLDVHDVRFASRVDVHDVRFSSPFDVCIMFRVSSRWARRVSFFLSR